MDKGKKTTTRRAMSEQNQRDLLKALARERFALIMDETSIERQAAPDPVDVADGVNSPGIKQSESDYIYNDDFENADFNEESSSRSSSLTTTSEKSEYTKSEKGELETSGKAGSEKDGKEGQPAKSPRSPYDDQQSDDSEPEPEGDHYIFTEDQKRAMMELMVQKEENGEYPDDPPEYNVKERLKELNDELAREPYPEEDDRKHRVDFKEELVDLVAPPAPDTSDDETPRKTIKDESDKEQPFNNKANSDGSEKKQFVIERDGKFFILAAHELTASERAMLNVDKDGKAAHDDVGDHNDNRKIKVRSNDNFTAEGKRDLKPTPPLKPRPFTAQPKSQSSSSSLRPRSAGWNYGMSPDEKQRAKERAKLREQRQQEEERRHKTEEEYRRKEAEDAYQAWLQQKLEVLRKTKDEEDKKKQTAAKEDKSTENEKAYQTWLKEKQGQMKREKLLKKRQEQEIQEGYYIRSREECDKAYREWLRKKYAEVLKQRSAEKQRNKTYRILMRKTRKNAMMVRSIHQAQAFRYVDYYGGEYQSVLKTVALPENLSIHTI
ncbi:coiled-coil domain-containing protein 181-like isoform X4 [Pomacea canaliculata]|uniref:coiled-coil domain-containing protein 181-like isoform X4 n=1 Tax=Pomacea canaliculata TaxID=400727 RepID=UPI000D72DF47|nr:coiled-coil domain-containing protein 181-like isoform X4 [Pomacea canaliculata]